MIPTESEPNQNAKKEIGSIQSQFQSYESLHFVVRGSNLQRLIQIAGFCEEIYAKIMFDTNLLSFKPKGNYHLLIYRNWKEYQLETGYPPWSGGGTITIPSGRILPSEREKRAQTAIFTFEEMATPSLLTHEISHLVFNEFMDYKTEAEMESLRWLNEGLATFEEFEAYEKSEREDFFLATNDLLKKNILPLKTVVGLNQFALRAQVLGSYNFGGNRVVYTDVDVWYWHVRSITAFLIERGGQYNFYHLLKTLKQKKDLSLALVEAYPGKWRSLAELENDWKQSF